jgi:ribosome maturation factor RimP
MRHVPEKLNEIVESVVTSMGYEFVGAEFHRNSKNSLLRIFIDQEDGITLDDCSSVSHQISGVLDVEDPIAGNYTLEVSSPGLDRPLFTADQFARFAGNKVKIKLLAPKAGRRKFTGTLKGIDGDEVVLTQSDGEVRMKISDIDQARLVPEI